MHDNINKKTESVKIMDTFKIARKSKCYDIIKKYIEKAKKSSKQWKCIFSCKILTNYH